MSDETPHESDGERREVDATQPMPRVGADPGSHEAVPPEGGHGAWLVVVSGSGHVGERFRVLSTTTIGRSPNSDIFLDDVTVSREHAVIYNDPAAVRIEDKGSLNGTFVDGNRVEESDLNDGAIIQVGKYRLSFVEEER